MIRMINGLTGSTMWVDESRLDEYLGAGHKLASASEKPAPPEPVKRPPTRKKSTMKK